MKTTTALASQYILELQQTLERIPLDDFDAFIETMMAAYSSGATVFVMGNGGSASTASHFACDVNKGVCEGLERRFRVLCLNDSLPTVLAYANDRSYEDIFAEQIANFLRPRDVVVGISGSGNSPNVLKAIEYANEHEGITVGLSGHNGGKLAHVAQHAIVVPSYDMQKVEDLHMVLVHMAMQILRHRLRDRTAGPTIQDLPPRVTLAPAPTGVDNR